MGECDHKTHANVFGGVSKRCQVYPRLLCHTVLEGIAAQKVVDKSRRKWNRMLSLDEIEQIAGMAEEFDLSNVGVEGEGLHHDQHGQVAFDDVSGEQLDPSMVRRARAEGLE